MSAQVDLSVGIPIDIKEFFDMPSEVDIAKRELVKVLHELAASIVPGVCSEGFEGRWRGLATVRDGAGSRRLATARARAG